MLEGEFFFSFIWKERKIYDGILTKQLYMHFYIYININQLYLDIKIILNFCKRYLYAR
jgi:hypothetical protein